MQKKRTTKEDRRPVKIAKRIDALTEAPNTALRK